MRTPARCRRWTHAGARALGHPLHPSPHGSSWLPSRRPSHNLLRQQRLLCICTATSAGTWCPRRCHTETTNMSLPSVKRPPGMAVRKAPAGLSDKLWSLAASRCPWGVSRSEVDSMSAWHASSPFLLTSCCAPSSPFLLSRNSVGRYFAAASHLHCSAYRA